MDNLPQHSKRDLPNTPRICDKILEYYEKFGRDRDLKKFMRLYSPTSDQDNQNTPGGGIVSLFDYHCKQAKSLDISIMSTRPLSACSGLNSKSLPNIEIQRKPTSENEYFSENDVNVVINIVEEKEKQKTLSISARNLKTPKKTLKNTKTQTPESVAKTHRRLEWDSLGDVGYKKSMSTSNISTIERSLLRELFKEKSVVSEPSPSTSAIIDHNISDKNKIVKNLRATNMEHGTPPLACSTLIARDGAKPKMISQSTSSTSLCEKFEKYAQTSLIKQPTVRSQEVQCTMSSPNSIIGTSTPSSFEYYSSKSSKSKSSKSSNILANSNAKKHLTPPEHPFITSITDLLMKRKALGEKNQQENYINKHEKQANLHTAINENKENQSHSSLDLSTVSTLTLSKQAPELDLGIQLICSLVDAKSINGRQKKELVREIIKRITHLEVGDHASNSTTTKSSRSTTVNSSDCPQQHVYDSVHSSNNRYKKEMVKLMATSESEASSKKTKLVNTNENRTLKSTTTSATESSSDSLVVNSNNNNTPRFPCKKNQNKNYQVQNNTSVSNEAASRINKEPQSELIILEQNKGEYKQSKPLTKKLEIKHLKTNENKINRCTQTSKTSLASTSASTTPDLTTQKIVLSRNSEMSSSNADTEQCTMRDWLNPMTQSEIEYEEKKQNEMRKKAETLKEKLNHDCGRVQQINWIENEIKRLECLKHLLLKDETTIKSSATSEPSLDKSAHVHKNFIRNSSQMDKLYDIVYSDKSSVLSKNAEQLVQEIEIVLEESHEDVVSLKDKLKRTKHRKKETEIIYQKEEDCIKPAKAKTKPKFRIINENINIHEEQLINGSKQQQQREKIDTPSTEKSEESESLRNLVQQRKREFIEAYKSKKQHHYEALKQQHNGDVKYLNSQRKLNEKPTTTTDSEHYSVPHTLPRKFISNDVSYYTQQHPQPLKQPEIEAEMKAGPSKSIKSNNNKDFYTTSANIHSTATTSSSSMFCMSSDISVPMGSQNTSSTPTTTTTHKYDDVAAVSGKSGVAVQTGDSIMRSKPIYGPTNSKPTLLPLTGTASIQVKPKGIAYVIEFKDNKHGRNGPIFNTDMQTKNTTLSMEAEPLLTLQEHLEKSKPTFVQHSNERKAILNKLQSMRQERYRKLREIIDNTSLNSLDRRLQHLPPPPIQRVRILKTKEMKALTNKRFASLTEVVAKQERETEEKTRRSNRILRDTFNKRLQKRVRSGKLSLNHSKTII